MQGSFSSSVFVVNENLIYSPDKHYKCKTKNNECKTIPKHLIPTNTYFCFKFHAAIKILQRRFLTCNLSLTLDESSSTMMTEMSTTPTQMTSIPSSSVVASTQGETHLVAVL